MNSENGLFLLVFAAIIAKPLVRRINQVTALRRENKMLKAALNDNDNANKK
jgi:hypothetical protein